VGETGFVLLVCMEDKFRFFKFIYPFSDNRKIITTIKRIKRGMKAD
jgi:hypothetical protein